MLTSLEIAEVLKSKRRVIKPAANRRTSSMASALNKTGPNMVWIRSHLSQQELSKSMVRTSSGVGKPSERLTTWLGKLPIVDATLNMRRP